MLRWCKYSLITLALVCGAAAAAIAIALALALDATSRLQRAHTLPPREAAQLKDLANLLSQTSAANTPQVHHLPLSHTLLDLGLHDAVMRLLHGSASITLGPGIATVHTSLPLNALPVPALQPLKPLHRWLNITLQFNERPQGPPALTQLRIGQLPLPPGWALTLAQHAARHIGWQAEWAAAQHLVQTARIHPEGAALTLAIPQHLQDHLRNKLLPAADQARLQPYAERLAQLISATAEPGPIPMTRLMPPLFALAQQQTGVLVSLANANPHTEAAQENRAALLALALHATGQPWARIAPQASQWRLPPPRPITLNGREDLAQHYLASAVIGSGLGGGRLSNLMGLYKELADSRSGSGFSFDDMAADRAGTRLGQRAVHAATALQAQLAGTQAQASATLQDHHLMLPVADLPSLMPEADFKRRYGAPGSPNYQREMTAIEARINELPVLK